jgi:hypothetical protein
LSALNQDDRRTCGKRVGDTKVGLGDDHGFEAVLKEKKGAPAAPLTRSPQRNLAGNSEGDDDGEEGEEEGEYETDEDEEE